MFRLGPVYTMLAVLLESVLRASKAEEAQCSCATQATDLPAAGRQRSWGAKQALTIVILLFLGSAHAGTACESDFEEFLKIFQVKENQYSRIRFPLNHSYLDMAAEPEPQPVFELLSQKDLKGWGIYPDRDEITERSLEREINRLEEHIFKVIFRKAGTGIRLVYYFEYYENCWQLIKYDNQSM